MEMRTLMKCTMRVPKSILTDQLKIEDYELRVESLLKRLKDAETSLRIYDEGLSSEYWERHPGPLEDAK